MMTKPVIFLLTFAMTMINFVVILIPVAVLFFPIFLFFESLFDKVGLGILYFLVSRISMFMLLYMALDFIFGFSVSRHLKKSAKFEKATSVQCHDEIMQTFEWLKKRFGMPGVQLYVGQKMDEINAYAIGSFGRKCINISIGLINDLRSKASSREEYIDSIKGVLGHEMSHLANKDYLPGLIVSANVAATRHVSFLFRTIFRIVALCFLIIPFFGKMIYAMIMYGYILLAHLLNGFNKLVFFPIYNFLMNWFSRSIEYRCDKESAKAFGGRVMQNSLRMVGGKGYITIFSTHPSTKNRIKNVDGVRPQGGQIEPDFITSFSNMLSVLLVVAICAYSTYKTDVPGLYEHYMQEVHKPILVEVERVKSFYYDIKEKF